jgi:1-acyl-sn-glycerol-3-phosphate acyltransferase
LLISPRPFALGRWAIRHMADFSLWCHLNAVYELNAPPALPPDQPWILAPNHNSFWDGFAMLQVARRMAPDRTNFAAMLGVQLRKMPLFRATGAYGFWPENPQSVSAMLDFTAGLLAHRPPITLLYYPEGRISPDVDTKPYRLRTGLARLPFDGPAVMLPIYHRTEPLTARLPTLFIMYGAPIDFQAYRQNPAQLTEAFTQLRTLAHQQLAREAYGQRVWGTKIVQVN